jgi:hypothetical protein
VLGCVVRFSIVWCTGRVFDFCQDELWLCIACFGCLSYHQRCVGVCFMWVWSGASRVVFTRKNGQLWAGQRWSDMNNMYGWLAENTCRGAGRLHSMALCISYLSPRRIAKEGAGNGYEGSGSMLLYVRTFGWVSPAGFGIVHISTCLVQAFEGRGFCECGPLAGNALRNTHYSQFTSSLTRPELHTMHAISHLL